MCCEDFGGIQFHVGGLEVESERWLVTICFFFQILIFPTPLVGLRQSLVCKCTLKIFMSFEENIKVEESVLKKAGKTGFRILNFGRKKNCFCLKFTSNIV
jgi:hypothetical protein